MFVRKVLEGNLPTLSARNVDMNKRGINVNQKRNPVFYYY